jgi:Carbohydrate/starch-binding module (family 21)
MKKIILFLTINLLLISCSQNEESIIVKDNQPITETSSKLAPGQKVKLIKAGDSKSIGCSRGGCYTYQYRDYVVEVFNVTPNKLITVHQQLSNGQWEDFNLTYNLTTSTGTEIWKGSFVESQHAPVYKFGEEIAVKYEVNGQTYWDNNNGANYKLTNMGNNSSSVFMNNEFNILGVTNYLSSDIYGNSNLYLIVDVRNIAFAKEVKIVYTTNNWTTTNTKAFLYNPAENTGRNPDFERWSIEFQIPAKTVTYALSYKVNGQTYWDNNFGKNYTLTTN